MAQRNKSQFAALYGSFGSIFPDNTTGDISEADMRSQGEDIKDSLVFLSDNLTDSSSTPSIGDDDTVPTTLLTGSYYQAGTILSASILTGFSAPVELIPAPGANRMILPISIILKLDYQSIAYATNTTVALQSNGFNFGTIASFLAGVADTFGIIPIAANTTTNLENQALKFAVTGGNPTAGNSTIIYNLIYRVVAI